MATQGAREHIERMSTDDTPPRYTLDVKPSTRIAGNWEWVIRDRGKLAQRSDRVLRSEEDARKHGEAEIDRILHPREHTR